MKITGWPVLAHTLKNPGAVYVRIPRELQQPIDICRCTYCVAHPDHRPTWDTLGVPLAGGYTWTLHAPEWSPR
jgi:hypothetical protein